MVNWRLFMGSLEKLKCAWKKGLGFGDNPHG